MARPTMVFEEEGIKRIYWSCPVKFVPDSVWSFIRHYNFYRRHQTAPFFQFDDVSPRYRLAENIYERALREALEEK